MGERTQFARGRYRIELKKKCRSIKAKELFVCSFIPVCFSRNLFLLYNYSEGPKKKKKSVAKCEATQTARQYTKEKSKENKKHEKIKTVASTHQVSVQSFMK